MTQQEFFNRYSYNVRTDKIGGGSFGTVYKAYDNVLDRTVAIKVSEVKILGGKEFSLLDEFDAIKDLPLHANIANYEALYNFDQANGIFDYAVLQYYPDGNLKDLIKKSDLSQEERENAALHVLAGLEFLHSYRVVHRDMKPSNILIQTRKQGDKIIYIPKITDFGLSKKADPSAKSRFTNSFGGGTLEYSSPEQLRGQNLRFNTDLWAWAVITYELFTGNPMFKTSGGGSDSAEAEKMIFDQILNSELTEKLSGFPQNWQRALASCLDRNPETRVKTADDIRTILSSDAPVAPVSEVVSPVTEPAAPISDPVAAPAFEVPEVEAATRIDSIRQPEVAQSATTTNSAPVQSNDTSKKSKAPLFIGLGIGVAAIVGVALFFMLKPKAEVAKTLTAKQENELYGYANEAGEWVIPARFVSAEPFADGKAKVRSNDSIYYIDEQGEMVEFIALATIDPVDVPEVDVTDVTPVVTNNSDDAWKADFEKKYNQLLGSEHKRTDVENLKDYQNLLKTVPSYATTERNKVNSRIKFFKGKVDTDITPVNNNTANLYGLKDIYNEVYDYIGEVINGKPNGKGTAKFKSGIKYVGDFKNGYREGQGTVTFKDGSKYSGGFKADKKSGYGSYTWADGGKYVGDWLDNKMHGKGTYTFPDKSRYVGDWVNDYMQGNGIYYYKDGSRYDGQWKNDKRHGWGKYYNTRGVLEYEGRYENDERLF